MNYGEGGGLSASDVALIQDRNGNNDSFGGNGAWWIILLFLVLGWGRGGYGFGGGYGNGGGTSSVYEGYVLSNDFSQLNSGLNQLSRQMSDTYNMTDRKLDGITNGLCSLGYQELQNINGVNTNVSNGFYNVTNAITTNGYETRNAITQDTIANMQNTNAITSQIANCCCDLKGISKDNRYENLQNINMLNNSVNNGFVALQQANCLNTRDIIESQSNNTREILKALADDKLERKNEQIALLQTQLNNAELKASQEAQSSFLLSELKPCPKPAFITCNPWGCNCNQGCGCNM